jgi:RNA polymerase sigma factor (sigma-70 family)
MNEPRLKLVSEPPRTDAPDDLALAKAAAAGDPEALSALLGRVFGRVRRTTSYLARCREDAEDSLQLALVEIARSIGGFRGECPIEHWVDRIAVRTASEQLSKRRRREGLFALAKEEPAARPVPLDEAADRDRVRRRLAEILSRLSPKNRTVLVLHYVWGYGVAEIARIAECKENTVRGRVRQGRKQLKREILEDPVLSSWIERRRS